MVVCVLVAIAAASIAFALRVTPLQSVTVAGQTVAVGTTSPSLSLSGPGQLDLFGQSMPTRVQFVGPVRPRLVLTNITINDQVAGFLHTNSPARAVAVLGDRLAAGWRRYFAWEIVFAAIGALLLLGLIAGWRRTSWRRRLAIIVGGLVVVEGLNLGLIMLTAYSAPRILHGVDSLSQLVGQSRQAAIPAAAGPRVQGVQAVVIGDSTAAGLGNPLVAHPTAADRACHRSADAYAVDLARVNGWTVENLACSGATVRHGLLGPQDAGSGKLAPQVAELKRIAGAPPIIVSIGANDMQWADMVRLCAVGACSDRASAAYFQRSLNTFAGNYYDLLRQLTDLSGHPPVIVNLYYAPFTPDSACLASFGLTPPRLAVLLERLDALNSVLAEGAKTFGYASVSPDFSGHELCTPQPYVQGPGDPAPFHPNAYGQLAIALADERALSGP